MLRSRQRIYIQAWPALGPSTILLKSVTSKAPAFLCMPQLPLKNLFGCIYLYAVVVWSPVTQTVIFFTVHGDGFVCVWSPALQV